MPPMKPTVSVSVVIAAAAYGLYALDMVYFDLVDLAGFEEECVIGRQLGYDGKMAIHPKQVPIINRVFSPTAKEVAQAQKIVDAVIVTKRDFEYELSNNIAHGVHSIFVLIISDSVQYKRRCSACVNLQM